MAGEERSGNFTISAAPVAAAEMSQSPPETEETELPAHVGTPILLAIPRNPRILFVCWAIDWLAAFGSDFPADRRAHLKLRSTKEERTHAVEPLSGNCAIVDLEPGATYMIELGYYGANETWRTIARAGKVAMPRPFQTNAEELEVAAIPFQLTFRQILDAFGVGEEENIAQRLAHVQNHLALDPGDEQAALMAALQLSAQDTIRVAQGKAELTKTKPGLKQWRSLTSSPLSSSWQPDQSE